VAKLAAFSTHMAGNSTQIVNDSAAPQVNGLSATLNYVITSIFNWFK
jgi:hypothetical protein